MQLLNTNRLNAVAHPLLCVFVCLVFANTLRVVLEITAEVNKTQIFDTGQK